jgi:hypothetical protein
MNRPLPTLDAATARRLAVEGSVEPRTLLKALRGEPVRGMAGQRAREVLERHGLIAPADRHSTTKVGDRPETRATLRRRCRPRVGSGPSR